MITATSEVQHLVMSSCSTGTTAVKSVKVVEFRTVMLKSEAWEGQPDTALGQNSSLVPSV